MDEHERIKDKFFCLTNGVGCDELRGTPLYWNQREKILGADCTGQSPSHVLRYGDYNLYLEPTRNTAVKHISNQNFSRVELYNVVEDPLESQNLADSMPEKVAEMMALMPGPDEYDLSMKPANFACHGRTYTNPKMSVRYR